MPVLFSLKAILPCMFLVLHFAPPTRSQPGPEIKLTPSDPHPGQEFGAAVAVEGPVVVVGAFRDDPDFGALEYGAAYVFGYDGDEWIEVAKLRDPAPAAFDWFGRSVAVTRMSPEIWGVFAGSRSDDMVAVNAGAVEYAECRGALIIALVCTTEATLFASDGEEGDHFGRALAVDPRNPLVIWMVVGAPQHDLAGFDEGAAYVYRNEGGDWIEEQKLTASDAADAAYFGESVAISGNRALIGAWGDSPTDVGQNAGAAYVFEFDGSQWVETSKLVAPDSVAQAQFGLTVALTGDQALVGAPLNNALGSGAGAAYLFKFDGSQWDEGSSILNPDHTGFNLFGSAVAVDESGILVGAENWFPPGGNSTGKAFYITDTFTYTLISSDGGIGDLFGSAAAVDGGVLAIGAPSNVHPDGTGAAYVYGEPVPTAIGEIVPSTSVVLAAPSPNPFRQQSVITLTLAHAEAVRVSLFDLLGREVRILHDGVLGAQTPHRFVVSADGLPSGVYLIRVVTPSFAESRRVVLQR